MILIQIFLMKCYHLIQNGCYSKELYETLNKMRQETNSNNDNRKTVVKVNKENSNQIIPTSNICKAQVKGSCHRTKAQVLKVTLIPERISGIRDKKFMQSERQRKVDKGEKKWL